MPPPHRTHLTTTALLCTVLLAGAGVRLWGLGEQSVWYDEFNAVRYLDAPDLGGFLAGQQEHNDEMVPLYFVLQYGWSRLFGADPWLLRLLSVLLSLGALLGAYAVGALVYGRGAGLLAAACFALSPTQIYHGQGLRPYALLALLGVWSCYALLRHIDTRRWRWAWLAVPLNGLALWTHLFALWLLPVQFLALALWRRDAWRRVLLWAASHLLFLAPLALLVSTWDIDPPFGARQPLVNILFHVFMRDAIYPASTDAALRASVDTAVLAWPRPLLAAVYLCALLAGLVFLWGFLMQPARAVAAPDAGKRRHAWFLVCWAAVPVLLLYAFAWVWSPDGFVSRYTLYAAPAVYALAGGALAGIARPRLRRSAAALLLGAMAVMAVAACAGVTRPDFRGAARYVAETRDTATALAVCPEFLAPVLAYNAPDSLPRVTAADNLLTLLQQTERELMRGAESQVVLVQNRELAALDLAGNCRRYLEARGVLAAEQAFPGTSTLFVYTAKPPQDLKPLGQAWALLQSALDGAESEPAFLLLFGGAARQSEAPGEALQLFARAWRAARKTGAQLQDAAQRPGWADEPYLRGNVATQHEHYALEAAARYAETAETAGRVKDAVAFLRGAVEAVPGEAEYRIMLAGVLRRAGRFAEAEDACRKGLATIPGAYRLRVTLAGVLRDGGNTDAAMEELEGAIETAPERPYAYTELGLMLHRLGRHGLALPHLEKAVALRAAAGDPGPLTRFTLLETLLALGRIEEARRAAEACRELGLEVPPELAGRLGAP